VEHLVVEPQVQIVVVEPQVEIVVVEPQVEIVVDQLVVTLQAALRSLTTPNTPRCSPCK
jgi:hypothetical protein